MLKILSWNVNGFRSIIKNGFWTDILKIDCDFICFQEVKLCDLSAIQKIVPRCYNIYDNISSNGRNGVLVMSKQKADSVDCIIGHNIFDGQGRYLKIEYPNFTLINLYMPHGGRDKSKLPFKLEVAKMLNKELMNLAKSRVILATDFNIARDDIDVCRANHNYNNIMFTGEERMIVNDVLCMGYKDVYREMNPQKQEYTWWSYAFECRKRNIGWRIDYFFVSESLMSYVNDICILQKQMGSDHCPIIIEIKDETNEH